MKRKPITAHRRQNRLLLPLSLLLLALLLVSTFRGTHLPDGIPDELARLAKNNPNAAEFVREYPRYYGTHQEIDLSEETAAGKVPLLLQWDRRWGYEDYGSSVMGVTGCGPTCLSMVALGVTGNADADPLTIAHYAEDHGYYSAGNGTQWTLMSEGCTKFGLRAKELPLSQAKMEDALKEGKPIILAMGPGDFTSTGHYIVLTDCDSRGFTVNDPNSPTRSRKKWKYDDISSQIRNIWAFSSAE